MKQPVVVTHVPATRNFFDLIAQARAEASAPGKDGVLKLFEAKSGLPRAHVVAMLARSFGLQPITPASLGGLRPAFDIVSYTEARTRACLALRDQHGNLLVAVCDPWSSTLRSWAEEHIQPAFGWGLIHPTDLAATLSQHEASVTAIESLAQDDETGQRTAILGAH